MEKIGQLLQRATACLLLRSPPPTPIRRCRRSGRSMRRKLAAHQDAIYLESQAVCARRRPFTTSAHSLKLDPESLRLVEYDYKEFVHAGANLSDADKAQLKKLNEELATLSNAFSTKLLAATKDARLRDHRQSRAGRPERCADQPPLPRPPRTARSRATSFRCRTRRSSPTWSR